LFGLGRWYETFLLGRSYSDKIDDVKGVAKLTTPFGILFREEAPISPMAVQREYDPVEQMSFCRSANGERVPFVTLALGVLGATGTGTATRAADDSDDSDPEIPRPKPKPRLEVKATE